MKLYRVPNPWDYHKDGGYLVRADSAEDAISILSVWLAERPSESWRHEDIQWEKVTEITDAVYEESGCDC